MEVKQAVAIFLERPTARREPQGKREAEEGPGANREVQAIFCRLPGTQDAERSEILRQQLFVSPLYLLLRTAQDLFAEAPGPDLPTVAACEADFDRHIRTGAGKAED